MFTYLMVSKLLYLPMDWEIFNQLLALEQVRGVMKALQPSIMVLLTKIVCNISLKTLTILAKKLILYARLGPGSI